MYNEVSDWESSRLRTLERLECQRCCALPYGSSVLLLSLRLVEVSMRLTSHGTFKWVVAAHGYIFRASREKIIKNRQLAPLCSRGQLHRSVISNACDTSARPLRWSPSSTDPNGRPHGAQRRWIFWTPNRPFPIVPLISLVIVGPRAQYPGPVPKFLQAARTRRSGAVF